MFMAFLSLLDVYPQGRQGRRSPNAPSLQYQYHSVISVHVNWLSTKRRL